MNFEFVKNLDGLNMALGSCNNAEELAKTMPDLSIVASRKSAEVIAKFVYLIAHSENVEEMTFAEILSDYAVKNYLRKRDILDAFHFIRKIGNDAVHSHSKKSPDTAIAVLKNLHFAIGEVAKRMGLIANYPPFKADISVNPNASLKEIDDAGKLAQEMYEEYIISRDRAEKFLSEFSDLCSPVEFIPGDVDLNETLEFKNSPVLRTTIAKIQEHFGFLALQALKHLREDSPNRELSFTAEITIYGKNRFTSTGLVGFMDGLMNALPNAEGFKITSKYYGPSVAPWFNHEVKKEFIDVISDTGSQEQFTYTVFEFLYNHGEGLCSKYENGEWIDLKDRYSKSIVDKNFGVDWWCWNQDLFIDFDFEKHPDILEALHNCVRESIPADQLEYCEKAWKHGELGDLCSSIFWGPKKLRVVQDFLDKLNGILRPIIKECEGEATGNWYITTAPFAVASWEWTKEGFIVTGTEV